MPGRPLRLSAPRQSSPRTWLVVATVVAGVSGVHILVLSLAGGLAGEQSRIQRFSATYDQEMHLAAQAMQLVPAPHLAQSAQAALGDWVAAPVRPFTHAGAKTPLPPKAKPGRGEHRHATHPKATHAQGAAASAASSATDVADLASGLPPGGSSELSSPEPKPAAMSSGPATVVASSPSQPASASDSASAAPPSQGTTAARPPAGGQAFEWPQATRVHYQVKAYYRGDAHGSASVEWIRREDHYQVHVDGELGPEFAPIFSWRLTSEGQLTDQGLAPARYESSNRLLGASSKPRLTTFGGQRITLPSGSEVEQLLLTQDPASFLIQLTYHYVLHPQDLSPGHQVEMSVVTLKRVEHMLFEVVGNEVLHTQAGNVPCVHVHPHQTITDGGGLPADIWFSPQLGYLPVRIYVKMGNVEADLLMDRLPQVAYDQGAVSPQGGATSSSSAVPGAPATAPPTGQAAVPVHAHPPRSPR